MLSHLSDFWLNAPKSSAINSYWRLSYETRGSRGICWGARNLRLLGFCCGSEPGARGTSPGSPTMSTPRTKEALRTGLKLTMKLTVGVVAALTTAGFCQHLYSCIYDGAWLFLILGWVVFPIGVVHGWGIWFGWW